MSQDQEQQQRPAGVRGAGKPCSVEGCAKSAYYASGMCAMHHRRQERTGTVGPATPTRAPRKAKQTS